MDASKTADSGFQSHQLAGVLEFLRAAERLKCVTRNAWTTECGKESVAAHTWRIGLMAVVLGEHFKGVDQARLLKMILIHDLGEAIGGDIPAPLQEGMPAKAESERRDLVELIAPLPERLRNEIAGLWDEYEAAATTEAKLAKALDKLETIMQHNQGENPPDFDYSYNLTYGRQYTTEPALISEIRAILDRETTERMARAR